MSRVGKKLIKIPEKVTVTISDTEIFVKGPKGELKETLHPKIKIKEVRENNSNYIKVEIKSLERKNWAVWGLFRSLISNMIKGVTEGFEKKLEINGVGFKAALNDDKLILNVGYSHPVEYALPKEVSAKIEKNVISLSSFHKQILGQTAADIRSIKRPEPYKGKGIKYSDEIIRRKAGKAAKGGEK